MSEQHHQTIDWREILTSAGPYPLEAFAFVREGLNYAVEQAHEDPESVPEIERHICGQQLCIALRDMAIEKYGLLSRTVLDHWNVNRTSDFGRIVFAMIDAGLMTKTTEDTLDDFRAVYDFDEAFSEDSLLSKLGSN